VTEIENLPESVSVSEITERNKKHWNVPVPEPRISATLAPSTEQTTSFMSSLTEQISVRELAAASREET
jgi:hypothetical protein